MENNKIKSHSTFHTSGNLEILTHRLTPPANKLLGWDLKPSVRTLCFLLVWPPYGATLDNVIQSGGSDPPSSLSAPVQTNLRALWILKLLCDAQRNLSRRQVIISAKGLAPALVEAF